MPRFGVPDRLQYHQGWYLLPPHDTADVCYLLRQMNSKIKIKIDIKIEIRETSGS